jgi:uncharacterized membrane protein YfcA
VVFGSSGLAVDPWIAAAGLIVGLMVGMTGMGGGALMTPILVIIFRVHPLAAVSSDLVASLFMKPVGALVHAHRRTVDWHLILWLALGSVPSAFAGVLVLRALGPGTTIDATLRYLLGLVLLVSALAVAARALLEANRRQRGGGHVERVAVHRLRTLAIGIIGGLIVGMTSVGSGSVVIVMLMLLYPRLRGSRLVATDLAQAVPLVAAAALGHLLFGDFKLNLTFSILLGGIPGVYIGSRFSAWAPDAVIKPLLAFVLLASAMSLLKVPTLAMAIVLVVVVTIGLPLRAAVDATRWTAEEWRRIGRSRSRWLALEVVAAGVPVLGIAMAIAYFVIARPELAARKAEMPMTSWGPCGSATEGQPPAAIYIHRSRSSKSLMRR